MAGDSAVGGHGYPVSQSHHLFLTMKYASVACDLNQLFQFFQWFLVFLKSLVLCE